MLVYDAVIEEAGALAVGVSRSSVHRMVDRLQENSMLQPLCLNLDHGSKTTGLVLVRGRM